MAGVSELLNLIDRRGQGPSPGFGREHAFLALMNLGGAETMGRQKLAAASGVGEGSVRTILRRFKEAGVVDMDPAGIALTPAGKSLRNSVLEVLTPPLALGATSLTVGRSQAAILVKSAGRAISSGIAQRDASIKAGADGTTSYAFTGNRFAVHGGSADCEKDYPSAAWQTLRQRLTPRNGDAVIVCGAKNETLAKVGAVAAALTLI
jgi:Domain of unknown function (DUF4443)